MNKPYAKQNRSNSIIYIYTQISYLLSRMGQIFILLVLFHAIGNGQCVAPLKPEIQVMAPNCNNGGSARITNYNVEYVYTFMPVGPSVNINGTIVNCVFETSYTVIASIDTCFSTASDPFVIKDKFPSPNFEIYKNENSGKNSYDGKICKGDQVTLRVSLDGYAYKWDYNNSNTQSIMDNPTDNKTYSVTVTDNLTQCSSSKSVEITVDTPPIATIIGENMVCQGSTTVLTATMGFGYTWLWTWTNGSSSESKITVGKGDYKVKITDSNNCSSTSNIHTIKEYPVPEVTSNLADRVICSGEEIHIELKSNISNTSFKWSRSNNDNVGGIISMGVGDSISGLLTNYTNMPQTVMFTVIPTASGCSGSSKIINVIVNPLPTANMQLKDSACQNSDVNIEFVDTTTGKSPFEFTISGTGFVSNKVVLGGKIALDASVTSIPGAYTYYLKSVKDYNGCISNYTDKTKSIRILKNPTALIDLVKDYDSLKVDLPFVLNGTKSSGESSIVSYKWRFNPPLIRNKQQIEEYTGGEIDGLTVKNASDYNFKLDVIDANGCEDVDQKVVAFGPSTDCNLSLNEKEKTKCSSGDTGKFEFTIESTTAYDYIDQINYECDGCEFNPSPGKKDLTLHVDVKDIGAEKKIKILATFYHKDPSKCQGLSFTFEVAIKRAGIIDGKNSFDPKPEYNKNICIGTKDGTEIFKIGNVLPKQNLRLYYHFNNETNSRYKDINNGMFSLDLINNEIGSNIIYLDTIQIIGFESCNQFLGSSWEYNVIECRSPQVKIVKESTSTDTYCLNQSGIKFKLKDNNNYNNNSPITSYTWQLLRPNDEKIGNTEDMLIKQDSFVSVFLDKNRLIDLEFVRLVGKKEVMYTNPSVTFSASDTIVIDINGNNVATNPSQIFRYPGHIYLLEDTTSNICVQWSMADVLTDKSIDSNNIKILNMSTSPQVSKSGYAVFGNESLTIGFESYNKYLWADTWYKDGVCDISLAKCITRTYYNASLPPKGSPRSSEQNYEATIYPNPASGRFSIRLQGDWADTITVDMIEYYGTKTLSLGKVTKKNFMTTASFDINKVTPGFYFVRVTDSNGYARVHKLIVL